MSHRYDYPDNSDIIAQKARGRNERARLSFGKKLDILDKLRDDVAFILQSRRARSRVPKRSSKRVAGTVD
jgi:hypothetical protein